MDLVYFVRPGPEHEELRYSLRSLVNVPHDTVHLIGEPPAWVQNVTVHARPLAQSKYRTTTEHMRHACETPGISDPFVLMNDDFFAVRPVTRLRNHHRGTMVDVIRYYEEFTPGSPYLRGMRETLELLQRRGIPDPLSYELHLPLITRKRGMLRALHTGRNLEVAHKRTIYGNINHIGGTFKDDVKVRTMTEPIPPGPWISSVDDVFQYGVGNVVRWLFPKPGVYEIPPGGRRSRAG